MKVENLIRIQKALTLLRECPPNIKDVLNAGDKAIEASGLNPWCCNEGLATGHEKVRIDVSDLITELNLEITEGQAQSMLDNEPF